MTDFDQNLHDSMTATGDAYDLPDPDLHHVVRKGRRRKAATIAAATGATFVVVLLAGIVTATVLNGGGPALNPASPTDPPSLIDDTMTADQTTTTLVAVAQVETTEATPSTTVPDSTTAAPPTATTSATTTGVPGAGGTGIIVATEGSVMSLSVVDGSVLWSLRGEIVDRRALGRIVFADDAGNDWYVDPDSGGFFPFAAFVDTGWGVTYELDREVLLTPHGPRSLPIINSVTPDGRIFSASFGDGCCMLSSEAYLVERDTAIALPLGCRVLNADLLLWCGFTGFEESGDGELPTGNARIDKLDELPDEWSFDDDGVVQRTGDVRPFLVGEGREYVGDPAGTTFWHWTDVTVAPDGSRLALSGTERNSCAPRRAFVASTGGGLPTQLDVPTSLHADVRGWTDASTIILSLSNAGTFQCADLDASTQIGTYRYDIGSGTLTLITDIPAGPGAVVGVGFGR